MTGSANQRRDLVSEAFKTLEEVYSDKVVVIKDVVQHERLKELDRAKHMHKRQATGTATTNDQRYK